MAAPLLVGAAEVSFNRDVRPLLAEACFECHGPAKAKGGLRLDILAGATNILKSGKAAVVPGDLRASELLRRIRTTDSDERMPPVETGKPAFRGDQAAVLERWISEGAKWEEHWAFAKLRRPPAPAEEFPGRAENPIDAFVQAKLKTAGLAPGARASDRVLEQRLALDLAGLPPSESFAGKSWEEAVDRYLAAPSFGVRMGVWWLDLVRYADTEGYFSDFNRNVYPYRDYVIRAFNANKPFDQFTREQLAGDLLGADGWEGKIASGYNRLVLTTCEDGANAAEYRARYAADRVRNLGSVWLGLSLGCAQCHDHKYDPTTARDFYRAAAFFADIREEGVLRQPEVSVVAESEAYRDLKERAKQAQRQADLAETEFPCEQVVATAQFLATNERPELFSDSAIGEEIMARMREEAAGRSSEAKRVEIANYFRKRYLRKWTIELTRLQKELATFEAGAAKTLVTERGPMRTVRVLAKGNWMDESGPQVAAGFPEFLEADAGPERPLNRLDLANWLVDSRNPLTARVLANRLWQLFFGEGIARNLDDFGLQGEAPSNPELLDWLAAELIESGWDIKRLVRLMVTSDTYRQTSEAPDSADSVNHLFSRQNRFPIPAEFVRDRALSVAGLLSENDGGIPVKVYLPAGFLGVVDTLNEEPYAADSGERLYRRGIYLYRKRTFLHPTLAAFNASSREECSSQRAMSATPRQALALMNSPVFVEAARAFGERMFFAEARDAERIAAGFRWCLNREPSEKETALVAKLLAQQRQSFGEKPVEAARYLRTGNYRWPEQMGAAELAAWSDVARALLNLEESNTRY